jgi:hypothetical protein
MTKLLNNLRNTLPGEASVLAWNEKVIIPTYGIGKPEKNPMFLENGFIRGVAAWFIHIR